MKRANLHNDIHTHTHEVHYVWFNSRHCPYRGYMYIHVYVHGHAKLLSPEIYKSYTLMTLALPKRWQVYDWATSPEGLTLSLSVFKDATILTNVIHIPGSGSKKACFVLWVCTTSQGLSGEKVLQKLTRASQRPMFLIFLFSCVLSG